MSTRREKKELLDEDYNPNGTPETVNSSIDIKRPFYSKLIDKIGQPIALNRLILPALVATTIFISLGGIPQLTTNVDARQSSIEYRPTISVIREPDNYIRLAPLTKSTEPNNYIIPSVLPRGNETIPILNTTPKLDRLSINSTSPNVTPALSYGGQIWTSVCPNPNLSGHPDVSIKNPKIGLFLAKYTDTTDPILLQSIHDGSYAKNVLNNITPAMTILWGTAIGSSFTFSYTGYIDMPGTSAQFRVLNSTDAGNFMNTARQYFPAGAETYSNNQFPMVIVASVADNTGSWGRSTYYKDQSGVINAAGEILEPPGYTAQVSDFGNFALAHEEGNGFGLLENNLIQDVANPFAPGPYNVLNVSSTDEQPLCVIHSLTPTLTPLATLTPNPNQTHRVFLPNVQN